MDKIIQENLFQLGSEIPWENAGEGLSRQVLGYDGKLMLVKIRFDKDAVGNIHEHLHSQASYIESGVFELTIGSEKKILKKGDGYYVPPHVLHGCKCLETGVIIDSFSPAREDFI
ncbi:MAG: cupin domain-containing protein [Flavisolibacter sp.]